MNILRFSLLLPISSSRLSKILASVFLTAGVSVALANPPGFPILEQSFPPGQGVMRLVVEEPLDVPGTFVVQSSESLKAGGWLEVSGVQVSSLGEVGSKTRFAITVPSNRLGKRFYRVQWVRSGDLPPTVIRPQKEVNLEVDGPQVVKFVDRIFAPARQGDVLSYSISRNEANELVDISFSGFGLLNMNFNPRPGKIGTGQVTVRATGPNGLFAEDTFWVAVAPAKTIENQKITAMDNDSGDTFGVSVSVDAGTMAVGAPYDDAVVRDGGAVYLYTFQGSQWVQSKKIVTPVNQESFFFGFKVALSGDTLAITALGDRERNPQIGSVYLYQRNQGGRNNWGLLKKLDVSDLPNEGTLGSVLALQGNFLILTSSGLINEPGRGSIYIYERNLGGTNNWGAYQKLLAPPGTSNTSNFGVSIRLDANRILVSSIDFLSSDLDAGKVYLYEKNDQVNSVWTLRKTFLMPEPYRISGSRLGRAIGLSGDRVAISHTASAPNIPHVFIYQKDQGGTDQWGLTATIRSNDQIPGDAFGLALTLDPSGLVVGSVQDDTDRADTGSAYVFVPDSSIPPTWIQTKKLVASNAFTGDFFGADLDTGNGTLIISAQSADPETGNGLNSGAVYYFTYP